MFHGKWPPTLRTEIAVSEASLKIEGLVNVAPVHQVLHDNHVQLQEVVGGGKVFEPDAVDAYDLA